MEQVISIVKVVVEKAPEYLAAIDAVILAAIALCLLIPGEQPEKALRAVADMLAKFSRKPKA
jgi:hypothetical protein